MSNLQEFAAYLWDAVQQAEAPSMCSRVEFAYEESGVMLLLRMNQQLSEAFFGAEQFQFPLPLLENSTLIYQYALPFIQANKAALGITELMRAAEVGVMQGNHQGTYPDPASGVFYTPYVGNAYPDDPRMHAAAQQWGSVLLSAYSEYQQKSARSKSATLLVVHLPDTPFEILTDAEWWRIGMMNAGWNCANMVSRQVISGLTSRIRRAASQAHIVRYCP